MNKKFGFIAKSNIMSIMERTMKRVCRNVHAEEPTTTDDPSKVADPNKGAEPPKADPPKYNVNFEDLVAKARKEEKDKLYPQIETLKKDNLALTEKNNAHLLTIETLNKEIADLNAQLETAKTTSNKNDGEEVKNLKSEIKTLKKTIADLEQSKVDLSEVETRIKGEYEVKLYREQKLREAGNEIIPELVTGVTKEDIDSSFEVAKQRYTDIISKVVSTTTATIPVTNTNTAKFSNKEFRPEDIMNMTPQQWAEHRKTLGLK